MTTDMHAKETLHHHSCPCRMQTPWHVLVGQHDKM